MIRLIAQLTSILIILAVGYCLFNAGNKIVSQYVDSQAEIIKEIEASER